MLCEDCVGLEDETLDLVRDRVGYLLTRIRSGVYSERQDGTLTEILEEIERALR